MLAATRTQAVMCRVDTNLDEAEKVLMFQMVMKCADIGHLTQPRGIHLVR